MKMMPFAGTNVGMPLALREGVGFPRRALASMADLAIEKKRSRQPLM
jgi:hypothetical protein